MTLRFLILLCCVKKARIALEPGRLKELVCCDGGACLEEHTEALGEVDIVAVKPARTA